MATSSVVECSLCNYLSPNLQLHVSHVRLVHGKDKEFHMFCEIDNCKEQFYSFSAFNTHVYRKHRRAMGLDKSEDCDEAHETCPQTNIIEAENDHAVTFDDGDSEIFDEEGCRDVDYEMAPTVQADCQKYSAEFLLKLMEGRRLTNIAISNVIDGCRTLCSLGAEHIANTTKVGLLNSGIDSSIVEGLDFTSGGFPDPFAGLGTSYLQEKYFKENFPYVVSACTCMQIQQAR